MSRKIAKLLSAMLLALAIAVTQIPVSDAQASVVGSSDFIKIYRHGSDRVCS